MEVQSSALYVSDNPLWLHVPPSIQALLTKPIQVTYIRMLDNQELYLNREDFIHIPPASPECLLVHSVQEFQAIQLQHCSLKFGYEAIAVVADTSLNPSEYSPQQCLVFEASEAAHCFVFGNLADGTAWHSAVQYLVNRLQDPSNDRELAAVFDLRASPKASEKWREFEVTLVTEIGNSVERLVVDYSEANVGPCLEDFLKATCKRLCAADFSALASVLQSFQQVDKLLDGSQTRGYKKLMPFTPTTAFIEDEEALKEFKRASKLGDALRCELQINLRLAKRKVTMSQRSLESTLSEVQLQKLGIILESVSADSPSSLRINRKRRSTNRKYLGNTLEVVRDGRSARNSLRVHSNGRPHAQVVNTGRISLEPPALDDSPREKDCRVF